MDEDTVVSGRDVPIFTEAVSAVIKSRNESAASQKVAAASEAAAKASEEAALKSQKAALASEHAAKASEEASAQSEKNAAVSEQNAKASEQNSAASAKLSESWAVGGTAARDGEDQNNSKYYAGVATEQAKTATDQQKAASASAKAAKDSEAAALASQQAASVSEKASAASEKNAKSSEGLAAQSEKNAKVSETSAFESKENASTSEQNAAASAKLSESWAVGGTSSRDGEDENNAMYYAGLASASADAAAKSKENIGEAETNCSNSAEAAKASEEAAAASAANFDDSNTSKAIDTKDFVSLIGADGGRYRKLVTDVADAIIKKVSMSELCGQNQTVQGALNTLNADLGNLSFGQDGAGNYGYKIGGADSVNPFNPLTAFAGKDYSAQGTEAEKTDNKGFTHTIPGSANHRGTLLYIGYWWAPYFGSVTFSNATVQVIMPTINMVRDENYGVVIGMVKFQATGNNMNVRYYVETNAGSTTIFHTYWVFD